MGTLTLQIATVQPSDGTLDSSIIFIQTVSQACVQMGIATTTTPESALHVVSAKVVVPTTKGIHMGEGSYNSDRIFICTI
jgi:hypothetical protein